MMVSSAGKRGNRWNRKERCRWKRRRGGWRRYERWWCVNFSICLYVV